MVQAARRRRHMTPHEGEQFNDDYALLIYCGLFEAQGNRVYAETKIRWCCVPFTLKYVA